MERPLSPYMLPTWYCFQITSVLSILHRFTGIALALGSIVLAWWLVAVAAGGHVFAVTHALIAYSVPPASKSPQRRRSDRPSLSPRRWRW